MIKKILLIIFSLLLFNNIGFTQTGTYTTNGYFYLPAYGEYGIDAFNEYETYMQIADTQIEANKQNSFAVIDTLAKVETALGVDIIDSTEQDGTGTDDQTIDVFSLAGDTLSISLEDDGEATKTVDLSGYYNSIGDLPTATVTNGDSTHVPTSDNVYDFCETTQDYMQDLVDDDTPQLGDDLDMNEHNIQFDSTLTADHSYSGFTHSVTVGESVVFGEVLYLDATDTEWKKANAAGTDTYPGLVIALESKSDGQACLVLAMGYLRDDSFTWTLGDMLLLGETAGDITATVPSDSGDMVQRLGYAISDDEIFFNPSMDTGEI